MARGDNLEDRLVNFAVEIIKFTSSLPKTPAAKHLSGQILRSGTSPAPNYSEARGADSNNDFVHKLKIALKELNETKVWLLIAQKAEMGDATKFGMLIDECKQLSKIINASIRTVLNKKINTGRRLEIDQISNW